MSTLRRPIFVTASRPTNTMEKQRILPEDHGTNATHIGSATMSLWPEGVSIPVWSST